MIKTSIVHRPRGLRHAARPIRFLADSRPRACSSTANNRTGALDRSRHHPRHAGVVRVARRSSRLACSAGSDARDARRREGPAMIRFVLDGDESTRHGFAEKVEWPDGATFTIRELPSGRLLENGTAVRVLGVDPLDYFRIKESALCFVGGLPAPRADDGSRWLREQLARER
jgi:hypothetical protein